MEHLEVDKLIVPRLIESLGGMEEHGYPTEETMVKLSLNPYLGGFVASQVAFARFARTAILFALPYMDVTHACQGEGPPMLDLPPLPFPRVAFEASENHCWPVGFEGEQDRWEIEAGCIYEVAQGREWAVMLYLKDLEREMPIPADMFEQPEENLPLTYVLAFSIHSDGRIRVVHAAGVSPEVEEGEDGPTVVWQRFMRDDPAPVSEYYQPTDSSAMSSIFWRFVVEVGHLMTARGVSATEFPVPRAARRSFQHKQKRYSHPTVYVVRIGGETEEHFPARSDREYHVRWLVRGHWMRFAPDSRYHGEQPDPDVPGGTRTWRSAHIRGPAGAPWRGRPVYLHEGT